LQGVFFVLLLLLIWQVDLKNSLQQKAEGSNGKYTGHCT
jgi:hypothetical protein